MFLKNLNKNKQGVSRRGQSILEFTFATIVFILLAYGMVKIMLWNVKILTTSEVGDVSMNATKKLN